MFRKLSLIFVGIVVFAFATTTFASAPLDLSTGVNVGAVGNPLFPTSAGTRDSYWFVLSTPAGAASANTQAWIKGGMGQWNFIQGTLPIFANDQSAGISEYERCFCLTDMVDAKLDLTMRADNVATLYLNSYYNPVVQSASNDTFNTAKPTTQFQYTSGNGLKLGKNCLRVRLNNEGGITAFALKATLQARSAYDFFDERSACCSKKEEVFTRPLR